MNYTPNAERLASLQSECDAYNTANSSTLTVAEFVALVMNERADTWKRQNEPLPSKAAFEQLKADRDALALENAALKTAAAPVKA